MRMRNGCLAAVIAVIAMQCALASAETPVIPPEIAAMLQAHLGSWRAEGSTFDGVSRKAISGTWECRKAVKGPGNVCTWNHEWVDRPHDSALEIMGYNPQLKVLSIFRVTDTGIVGDPALVEVHGNTMIRDWKFEQDGKSAVGHNEIVVKSPGLWEQHVTIDVEGKRVWQMDLTQRRVK